MLEPVILARSARNDNGEFPAAEWTPKVDIAENDKEWLIKLDVPDVRKEHVKVSVNNGTLSISGDRKQEDKKGETYIRIERPYGTFVRSFSLPDAADSGNISAECRGGVLIVKLPKSERVKPQAIEVQWD